MNFKDLPQPYKELAERNTIIYYRDHDYQIFFNWKNTPEGADFWALCSIAKTESELPALPNDEIKEAVKFIENYQNWRTGADVEQPTPSEISKHLNILIKFVKEKIF